MIKREEFLNPGKEYRVEIAAEGNKITARTGEARIGAVDGDGPYLTGSAGIAVRDGSHVSCSKIKISGT